MSDSFSIVIPARDEAANIGACIDAIKRAHEAFPCRLEIIVVVNRCTDDTEVIAKAGGARIVHDDTRNLSHIRNSGAAAATGDILLTIDADSRMSANMLAEVSRALRSGKYIGGGVPIGAERLSLGIALTGVLLMLWLLPSGISGGMFWCYRKDFEAIGGFDENVYIAEDIVFARRLKAYGKSRGKKFGTLWRTRIVTSCRKFDLFGDWFTVKLFLKNPRRWSRALRGEGCRDLADQIFYDVKR